MEDLESKIPLLPFNILIRAKKNSIVRTGHIVHVEDPQFVCEYSANKAPEKHNGLLLYFEEYNLYLFDWGLVDGSRLKVEYSELFSKMLEAARVLDRTLFLKFPDDKS